MLGLLKKKSVLTALFITGGAVLIFAVFGSNNFLNGAVKTCFSPILTLTSKAAVSVGNFKDYLIELNVYREENERLSEEITHLKKQAKDSAQLKAENDRLNELLNLKSSLKFNTVSGRVISHEYDKLRSTLVINKGSNDGVKVGSAVISSKGIVGKVTQVGIGWAKVSTVLNPDTAVGVRIVRNGNIAVTEGDTSLAADNCFKLSFFEKNTDIIPGDILEATGNAGVYPEGITLGTVLKTVTNTDGGEYAVVEPSVDFSHLYEILVVTDLVEE